MSQYIEDKLMKMSLDDLKKHVHKIFPMSKCMDLDMITPEWAMHLLRQKYQLNNLPKVLPELSVNGGHSKLPNPDKKDQDWLWEPRVKHVETTGANYGPFLTGGYPNNLVK